MLHKKATLHIKSLNIHTAAWINMVKITVNYHLPSSATRDFCHPHNCKGFLCQDWYQWWQKGKETPFHQIFSISWRNWHLCYHRLCIDKHGPSLLLHRYWKPESISLDKTGFGSVWLLLNIKFSNISAIYWQVLRTRQIIRYRATATLRRLQKKGNIQPHNKFQELF